MTDLFDTNQNETNQAPAAPIAGRVQSSSKPEPTVKPGKKKGGKPLATKDYIFFGGIAVAAIAVMYFFVFSGDDAPAPTGTGRISGQAAAPREPAPVDNDFREKISTILLQQKQQIDDVRNTYQQGMVTLSSQLKSANARIGNLSDQVNSLKMQLASKGNVSANAIASNGIDFSTPQKMLKEFSINDLSNDLGWVKYKNQVYAVQVGTTIGGATVTGFDMNKRIVYTNKGLIH